MTESHRSFVPAAGHDVLLPFYDPLQRLFGGDGAREELLDQATVQPGQRLLDLGCGTGSLTVQLKRRFPECEVVGIDPDPKALARATRKAKKAGLDVRFDQGFGDTLPYLDGSFDRVFSSFMFHHLDHDVKQKTLADCRRVLEPGGSLHILDFGGAEHGAHGVLARWLHSSEHMRDNIEGQIPVLMDAAGFSGSDEVSHRSTFFGRIACYGGTVPGA